MKNIHKYWSTFGGFIGLGILFCLSITEMQWRNLEPLLGIHFALLLFHQFEEYAYPGGFKQFFNQDILNKKGIMRFPLNDLAIIWVNIIIAWSAYGYCAFFNNNSSWLIIALLLITLFNGILHTVLAIVKKKYNPGSITGLFLFIPFSLFVLLKFGGTFSKQDWEIGIIIFTIGSACIPGSIYLSNKLNPPFYE